MLVKKSGLTKQTRSYLIVLAAVIVLGGGYLAYDKFFISSSSVDTEKEIATVRKKKVATFSTAILNSPQFQVLQRDKFEGFTEQYPAVVLSDRIPLPPTNIAVVNTKEGNTVVVTWELPELQNFSLVRVYRSTERGERGELVSENVLPEEQADRQSSMSIRDGELRDGVAYYYLVVTVQQVAGTYFDSSFGVSDLSAAQVAAVPSDDTPPAPPSSVQVSGVSGTAGAQQVEVRWVNPPDSDLTQMLVYRSSTKDQLGSVINAGADDPSLGREVSGSDFKLFIDSGVDANKIYYYTVISVDDNCNRSTDDLIAAPSKPYFYNPFQPIEF